MQLNWSRRVVMAVTAAGLFVPVAALAETTEYQAKIGPLLTKP